MIYLTVIIEIHSTLSNSHFYFRIFQQFKLILIPRHGEMLIAFLCRTNLVFSFEFKLVKVNFHFLSAKKCGIPTAPSNSKITLPCDLSYGSTCPVTCHDGFMLRGHQMIKCGFVYGRLQWDKRNTKCEGSSVVVAYLFDFFLFLQQSKLLLKIFRPAHTL